MSTPSSVYVIVLTLNRWKVLRACLASLFDSDMTNFHVVVVDNGSTDGTLSRLPVEFPRVRLIQNDQNLGYAEGNNVGLRYALMQNADYLLVLNDDTIVAREMLTQLVKVAEQYSNGAIFGPAVYHFDEPNVIQSAGGLRTESWRFYHRGQNETDHGQYAQNDRVAWISGCGIMARGSVLKKIGLIDPSFFIYSEEVDWCVRAQEAGYEIVFVPSAHLWHKGVQRNYVPTPRVTYLSTRNELLLLKKHHAGARAMTSTWLRHLRTLLSWSVRPRWKSKRIHRDAMARGLRDFVQGNFGAPPPPL